MRYSCLVKGRTLAKTLAAGAVLAALGTGCVKVPVLQLHSARINGVSTTGVILAVTMRVNNENSFDVRVRNVRANVTIQSRYTLPYLQYNPDTWLGSDASTFVPAPMTIPWVMVKPLLATSIGSSNVSYTLNGIADVTATRLLQIQANDYGINAAGFFSRADLFLAAGRGVLGGMTTDASLLAGAPPEPLLRAFEEPPTLLRVRGDGQLALSSTAAAASSPWDTGAR